MRAQLTKTNTESTPAVDSKPTTRTQKMFKVLVLENESAGAPNLRVFKILATTRMEAKKLAAEMVGQLDSGQIEAISLDAHDAGENIGTVEIVDVYDSFYDIPGHAWTRAELESETFDALVNQVAAELDNGNEQPLEQPMGGVELN